MSGTARVKKSTGSWYELLLEDNSLILGRLKGKIRLSGIQTTNPIAVGDFVTFEMNPREATANISGILPRRNYLIRKSNKLSRQAHIIAANLDQIAVLATLAYPRTSLGFIDRVLITAEAYDIPAVIIFNKVDLYDEEIMLQLAHYKRIYEPLDYPCHSISLMKSKNVSELKEMFMGRTTLVCGHSGVGKSTLLNTLHPDLGLRTGEISGYSLKGKHTTTFAEMHLLDAESFVIDTPGIKDFGVVDMVKEEVSHFFREMKRLIGHCRFSNCLHVSEPGCAVLVALSEGKIAPERYRSYVSVISGEDVHH